MSKLLKNIIFAGGFALILWLGYVVFIRDSDPALTASNAQVNNQAVRDAQDFLMKLQQLRTIELEGALFSDPRFNSLIDLRQEVTAEPVGRTNPFVPVEN